MHHGNFGWSFHFDFLCSVHSVLLSFLYPLYYRFSFPFDACLSGSHSSSSDLSVPSTIDHPMCTSLSFLTLLSLPTSHFVPKPLVFLAHRFSLLFQLLPIFLQFLVILLATQLSFSSSWKKLLFSYSQLFLYRFISGSHSWWSRSCWPARTWWFQPGPWRFGTPFSFDTIPSFPSPIVKFVYKGENLFANFGKPGIFWAIYINISHPIIDLNYQLVGITKLCQFLLDSCFILVWIH